MSALPPAGWYPDPEWGGARWRWWDGNRWAQPSYGYAPGVYNFDPEGFARTLELQADTTTRTGRWLHWVLAANAVSTFLVLVGMAIVFRRGFDLASTDPDGAVEFPRLWWPYVAVRELYPPGLRSPLALRWWLSYLIVPFAAMISVVIAALTGPTALCAVVVALAGGALVVPVLFGWRLIDDVDAMQRACIPRRDQE